MNQSFNGFYENQYHQEWKPPDILYTNYDNIKGREEKRVKYKDDIQVIPFDEIVPSDDKYNEFDMSLSNEWIDKHGVEFDKVVSRYKAAGPFGEKPNAVIDAERENEDQPDYDVDRGHNYLKTKIEFSIPKAVDKENIDTDGDILYLNVNDEIRHPKMPNYVNYKKDKIKRVNPEIEAKEIDYDGELELHPNYEIGMKKQPVYSFPKNIEKEKEEEPEQILLNPNYDYEKPKIPVYVNMAKQSKTIEKDDDDEYKHAEYDVNKGIKYLEPSSHNLVNMEKQEIRWIEPKPNEEQVLILNPKKVETKPAVLVNMGKASPRWKITEETEKDGDILDISPKDNISSQYQRPVNLVDISKQLGRMNLNEIKQYNEELVLNYEKAKDAIQKRVVTAPPLNKQINRNAPIIGEGSIIYILIEQTDTSNIDFTTVEQSKIAAGHKPTINNKPEVLLLYYSHYHQLILFLKKIQYYILYLID